MPELRKRQPRRRLRRRSGDDRGAIAITFVILLAGGVVMGMLALVIDVGLIYAEKEELQTGADAAAIAMAKGCAEILANCGDSVARADIQTAFVNANSRDGRSDVEFCGGNILGSGLMPCRQPTTCATPRPTGSEQYVEVTTSTRLSNGDFALPPVFSAALTGDVSGTRVQACARAQWGVPRYTTRLAISLCQYNRAIRGDNSYPPQLVDPPPYGTAPTGGVSREAVFRLSVGHELGNVPDECKSRGIIQSYGYGWLQNDGTSGDCVTENLTTQYDDGGLAQHTPDHCRELLVRVAERRESAEVMTVAIFDRIDIVDGRPEFHIVGMAAFVPTGYWFGDDRDDPEPGPGPGPGQGTEYSDGERSWLTGRHVCDGGDRHGSFNHQCIYGFFTRAVAPGDVSDDYLSYGIAAVSLAG